MAEVSRQLEPTHTLLQQLHEWQLAFWSNGSGRVPGFFQRRMKEDDQWRHEVAEKVDGLSDHKESVDKFILELRLAREFREQREKEAKERFRFWMLKVILPIVVGLLSILGIVIKQAAPVVQILIDDYLKAHPMASEKIKEISAVPGPVVAHDAGLPPSYKQQ